MNKSPAQSKFNPWPYALMGFFALFISLIVLFIVFALGQDMQLVRPDYYEEEMRYQQQIDRENRTLRVQDEVAVRYDPRGQVVGVKLPVRHAGRAMGRIEFYRPSNERLDHEVALQVGPDGHQTVPVAGLAVGLWNLHVFWEVDGEEYYTKQAVVIRSSKAKG